MTTIHNEKKALLHSANVITLTERDPMIGASRALPHRGLSALQRWKANKMCRSALRSRPKAR
jgi:hypothetical protein